MLTPGSHLYFDHYQNLSPTSPKAWGGYSPLKEVYEYEPAPAELEETYRANILGVYTNVWTEYMPDAQKVEYMVFPRIAALSEVVWAKGEKNWYGFGKSWDTCCPVTTRWASTTPAAPSAHRLPSNWTGAPNNSSPAWKRNWKQKSSTPLTAQNRLHLRHPPTPGPSGSVSPPPSRPYRLKTGNH
ncbi:MAG: family 20 glycosylhydrolase [Lewinellaceae bacterium]|nr:family 20 glycosylhydrolase [Lewinellaceae bacterium]